MTAASIAYRCTICDVGTSVYRWRSLVDAHIHWQQAHGRYPARHKVIEVVTQEGDR